MTIQNIADQIKSLKSKWQSNIVVGRAPDEAILKAHLGQGTSFLMVSSQIDNWSAQVDKVAGPRVSKGLPKTLVQSTLRALSILNRSVAQAANGLEWMFQNTGFGPALVLTEHFISELVKDGSKEQAQILDAAQARLSVDLKSLQDGGDIAKQFEEKWPNLQEQMNQIEASNDSIVEKVDEVSASATAAKSAIQDRAKDAVEEISAERKSVDEARAKFADALTEAQSSMKESDDLKAAAEKLVADISKQSQDAAKGLIDANEALTKATAQQIATHDRLTLALRDAQMEGLAGSFTRMTEKTETSIQREQHRFDQSLTYLASIGLLALLVELTYGFPKTVEEFLFRLVRMLSLAAPGIWIAWIASRKLSALNRVFSDYQYKSAAALAYESYRQTVAEAGSDELKQQLLAFAIHSFGENPTRYYDAAKNEAASPADSWLDRVPFLSKSSKSGAQGTVEK
jgi:hypothetical protein